MLTCDDFAGLWLLHRDIDDRYSGQSGDFRGTATIVKAQSDQLTYREGGYMRFGGGPIMTAKRTYQWYFLADRVDVRFEDGSAFHSFVPAGKVAGTDHPCGDDYYTVAYDFTDWPRWTATWTVKGPHKDYTSVSLYKPDQA